MHTHTHSFTGVDSVGIQDMHALNCTTSPDALLSLNARLVHHGFSYIGSSSSVSASASSSGGGGASSASESGGGGTTSITSLRISNTKGAITASNIEGVKALLTEHIGTYTPTGRSSLGAFA